MRFVRSFTAALAMSLTAACALNRQTDTSAEQRDEVITLNVANHNTMDVVIYTMRSGARRTRVGQVTASATGTFHIRLRELGAGGDLQLYADPIGATTGVTSDLLHLFAGQVVDWTLESA